MRDVPSFHSQSVCAADDRQSGDLTLADLLAGLGAKSGKLTKAEKQLAQLAKASKPVDAPLPRPIRARKERQVG